MNQYDVLIIGGGINGLATAYHLSRHTKLRVALLEQFTIGHPFGGSHGATRITRSTYINPLYSQLLQRAHREEWPLLEKELGTQLIYPNLSCYFGVGKLFESYMEGALHSGLDIDLLDISSMRQRFPQFKFNNATKALLDRTGGVIAAQDTIEGLKKFILNKGVALHENTKVDRLELGQEPIELHTDKGLFRASRLVITAGSWLPQLLPTFSPLVVPITQTVGYFKLKGSKDSYQLGQFPNWAYIGEGDKPMFYGLPAFRSEGIKIAHHITSGQEDPPLDTKILDRKSVV